METGYKFYFLLFCICFKVKYVTTQTCTATTEMGWPGTGDANSIGKSIDGFGAGTGYLIPLTTYTADCCGYVTQIEAFHEYPGTTTAQVWRPKSGTSFILVGAIDITGNNMFTYNVPVASQVKVQVGDVVGWYSSSANLVRYKRNTGLNGNLYKPATATAVGVTVNWGSASVVNDVTYAMKFYLGANSAPTFTNLPAIKSLLNTAAVSTSVYTVSATDADVSDVANLTISRIDINVFFSFDSATKQVSIGSVLADAIGNHQLVFIVSDSCATSTSTLNITVFNVPPTIHNLDNSTLISEKTQTATLLYTMSVTDPTDVVSCSLLTANVPFTVLQISGSTSYGIYCISNPGFNYATRNSYSLSIECTDGYDAVTGTFTVYIEMKDFGFTIGVLAGSISGSFLAGLCIGAVIIFLWLRGKTCQRKEDTYERGGVSLDRENSYASLSHDRTETFGDIDYENTGAAASHGAVESGNNPGDESIEMTSRIN